MADQLTVDLVAADRTLWSGEATMVLARTVTGDVGVLRGHSPMLALLADATVEITTTDGRTVVAAVDGGFLSVAKDRISVLCERGVLSGDVDINAARAELDSARAAGDDGDAPRRVARAEARIKAVDRAS